jgi:hypothetical protein
MRPTRPRRRPIPGQMNKLEERYEAELQSKKGFGTIVDYRYQAIKLKLAPNTFYTPDFVVTFEDRMELHEVKGFWEDDARVKIKTAAALYPEFLFVAVTYEKRPEDKKVRGAPRFWKEERFYAA